MARLGHKKSRLGCRQCKARHVKCDELKPCTNCSRHGVQCSLVTCDPSSAVPNPTIASAAGANSAPKRERQAISRKKSDISISPHPDAASKNAASPSDASSPSSQSDSFPFLSRFINKSDNSRADLWIRDIELIHHWTVEAVTSLSHREDIHHMWRVDVPKQAVIDTFLMHQMLAFAAFQKTYQSQSQDQIQNYYTLGIHHQDHAIKGLRQKLQNITPHESPSIVGSSLLLTLNVFASTGFEARFTDCDPIDGILNIFSMMQGMGSVLGMAHAFVVGSFLAPVFQHPTEATPSQPMLQYLADHLPTLVSFISSRSDLSEERRAEYLRTIGYIENSIKVSNPPVVDNRELRFLFMWPLHLEPGFLSDIKQRQPGALVILMYYATLMLAAEPLYWFMDKWGNRLLKACYADIDQSWLPMLRWPVSFLDRDPTFDRYTGKDQVPVKSEEGSSPGAQQTPIIVSYRSAPIHSLPAKFTTPNYPEQSQSPIATAEPSPGHGTGR